MNNAARIIASTRLDTDIEAPIESSLIDCGEGVGHGGRWIHWAAEIFLGRLLRDFSCFSIRLGSGRWPRSPWHLIDHVKRK
jgi:hypothetical protein